MPKQTENMHLCKFFFGRSCFYVTAQTSGMDNSGLSLGANLLY